MSALAVFSVINAASSRPYSSASGVLSIIRSNSHSLTTLLALLPSETDIEPKPQDFTVKARLSRISSFKDITRAFGSDIFALLSKKSPVFG